MLGPILVVLVIAHGSADPLTVAFERAVRAALGRQASLEIRTVPEDPPDADSIALGGGADGVVEVSWEAAGAKARLHCYVANEHRWVDREIAFGSDGAQSDREMAERGRLLGFAVATMFGEDERPAAPSPSLSSPLPAAVVIESRPSSAPRLTTRSFEFYGSASSGIGGTASGFGAEAAVRSLFRGPLWGRVFVAGRSGSIAAAQATTRSLFFGGGVAIAALPPEHRFALGLRADAFVTYFEASHFSNDDVVPDSRSRWLPGTDLIAEGGFRVFESAGVFLGAGVEALLGKTTVYAHGNQMAVVAPVRGVVQLGIRVAF
ncbi:MAG: hypothetical protein ABIQ16_21210 [Polyangiaceae bacterium]